jgi:hypothetical protein
MKGQKKMLSKRLCFAVALVFWIAGLLAASAESATYRILGDNYLDIGNEWTYKVHATKVDDEPVDLWGTHTIEVTHAENIEGYSATAVRNEYSFPGVYLEYEWDTTYNYLTQDYLVEVRHVDYESSTTARNNDPLEDLPVWVNDTDNNRHVGHGEFVGRSFDAPPGDYWYGSHDTYITFEGQETITVPAGTID